MLYAAMYEHRAVPIKLLNIGRTPCQYCYHGHPLHCELYLHIVSYLLFKGAYVTLCLS